MLELILTAINAKLAMLNKLANLYCLAERRPIDGGKTVPYAYRGGRDLQPINIDSGSVGYWRINGEGSDEYINDPYVAGQQRQVTWPLRFYAMAHRDSQFTASALADLIGSTITDADDDVAQLLDMEDVTITVSGRDLDGTALYVSEFDELDLPYHLAFIALTVTVTIRGSANCFPDPCDIDTDILHSFNFCDAATRARLTDEQVDCLTAALCETPPTLCEQLAEVLPADVVADVFDCLTPESQAELLDSECVIPPCDPVNVIVNGDLIGTPASGTNFTLAVELDGIESGAYNGAGVWEVTSSPCAAATAVLKNTANTTLSTTSIASGASQNITAPDATAVLKNTANTTLLIEAIPSNVSENITAPDATITLNGSAYGSAPSGTTFNVDTQTITPLTTTNILTSFGFKQSIAGTTPNLFRFRKNTGGTEFNVAADVNGYPDVTTAQTNLGADSAFLVRVYDLSGNGRDAYWIASTAQQPRLAMAAGSSKRQVQAAHITNQYMQCDCPITAGQAWTLYMALIPNEMAGAMIACGGTGATFKWWINTDSLNRIYLFDGATQNPVTSNYSIVQRAPMVLAVQFKTNELRVYANGTLILSHNTWSVLASSMFQIARRVDGGGSIGQFNWNGIAAYTGDYSASINTAFTNIYQP